MACAYLYKLGYKSGHEIVHQVVNETLIVQGRHKIKEHLLSAYELGKDEALSVSDNYLKDYEFEKVKRASFQYETTEEIKESKAQTSLKRAKEFLTLMEGILAEN
jgi:HEPN domain-containing protein